MAFVNGRETGRNFFGKQPTASDRDREIIQELTGKNAPTQAEIAAAIRGRHQGQLTGVTPAQIQRYLQELGHSSNTSSEGEQELVHFVDGPTHTPKGRKWRKKQG